MTIETIEHKGREIKITVDEWPTDPREWDNLGTMVCSHSRYDLGDKQVRGGDYGIAEHLAEVLNIDYTEEKEPQYYYDQLIKQGGVILPLYLYDHSGITISTSAFNCPWDSGQVGYIYATGEKIRKEYSTKRITKELKEKVANVLRGEVSTYDDYITGSVYCYETEDDSCCGFYGDDGIKEAIAQGKAAIDYQIAKALKDHVVKQKAKIKARAPLSAREAYTA